MASQYYTPFMAKAGQSIARGIESRGVRNQQEQQNKLVQSAYMGDPQAMNDLMQVNPELGIQLQEANRQRKAERDQQSLGKMTSFKKDFEQIMKDVATLPDFESAREFGDSRIKFLGETYPEIIKQFGEDEIFDEVDFQKAKTIYGDAPEGEGEEGGAFAGKGMPAQISSMLVKGVNNPEFRNTPEYARSWDIANEPTIIDTEQGRIPLYPSISSLFKPPGPSKSEAEEVHDIKQISETEAKQEEKRTKVIEGTEKKVKTTADEKTSFGYFNRMIGAEENIDKLGDFNSASVWEKFRGLTNITASPELQQYRQAADDWIRAKLRKESGAVIAASEMAKEYQIYFPQIGDSQAVISQKKAARITAENSMKISSGKAFKELEKKPSGEKKLTNIPKVGFQSKGYEFTGGDPSKAESWRKL